MAFGTGLERSDFSVDLGSCFLTGSGSFGAGSGAGVGVSAFLAFFSAFGDSTATGFGASLATGVLAFFLSAFGLAVFHSLSATGSTTGSTTATTGTSTTATGASSTLAAFFDLDFFDDGTGDGVLFSDDDLSCSF